MIRRLVIGFALVLLTGFDLRAQYSRYIIRLKDKTGSPFSITNPSRFLSQRAIERRTRFQIPISETDLPVNQTYIDSIRNSGDVIILNVSKWLNQVCIKTMDANALTKINGFSFVQSSGAVALRPAHVPVPVNKQLDAGAETPVNGFPQRPLEPLTDYYDYGLAYPQINLHNAAFLHNLGFRGNGVQIAITDAGFSAYNTLATFDSVRNNNQILDTWDFVALKPAVNVSSGHGTQCFSTIAANLPGKFIGSAPEASFYLYRTEDVGSEYPVEEQNWVAAAEKADSLGADIISVSLGYSTFDDSNFNHTYADMNGNTTLMAKSVNLAVQKGLLVAAAAGNDGNNAWHYIATPGDADSAFTIGAVNTNRQVAGFSSYGPSSDGQIKPDVATVGAGTVVASTSTGLPVYGNGTSFACPLMAGIVTCIKQAFPEMNNAFIIDALRKSSDKYSAPDDRTGYGIPDVKKAFVSLQKETFSWNTSGIQDCKMQLNWRIKIAAGMNIVVEKKLQGNTLFSPVDTIVSNSSFSLQNLNFIDDLDSLEAGDAVQYRLLLNIGTDTSFYLDSTAVTLETTCRILEEKVVIAPNPVKNDFTILIQRNNPTTFAAIVYNTAAQQVYQITEHSFTGSQSFTLPSRRWNTGTYYVSVWINNRRAFVKKIVKQ